jgi:hypothetical protein
MKDTMPEEKQAPKKRTRTPGTHTLQVTISDALFAKLEATADGRPINLWLSRLIERNATNFPELSEPQPIARM